MSFIIAMMIIFIEQLLIIKMLELFCPPKRQNKTRVILVAVIFAVSSQVINEFFSKNIIVNVTPFILAGMYSLVFLKGTVLKKISATLIDILNVMVINSMFIVIATIFNKSAYHLIYDSGLLFGYMLAVASKIFLYLEYCYLKNYLSKDYTLTANAWKFIIGILVLSFIAIGLTVNEFVNYKIHAYYVGLIVITFILVNVLIFYLCIMVSKQAIENANQKVLLESVWYENKLFETAQEKSKEINKVNHDFKHHIVTIRNLIDDGNQEEANRYLKSLNLPVTVTYIQTKNPVFNYILNDKIGTAKRKGIVVDYDIPKDVPEYLENTDLSSILGNLLDNAIEGCNTVDDKFMKINISVKGSEVVIDVRNTSAEVKIEKSGKILTTKENKRNHGFGMANIKAIVEKYHGDDFYSYVDGMFTHICILNGLEE